MQELLSSNFTNILWLALILLFHTTFLETYLRFAVLLISVECIIIVMAIIKWTSIIVTECTSQNVLGDMITQAESRGLCRLRKCAAALTLNFTSHYH